VKTSRAAVLILASSLSFTAARAEPRFAARFGYQCSVCHVNPTGGGPRTAYGRDVFEKQQLTLSPGSDSMLGLDFDPRIGDRLTLGGDFRLAALWAPNRSVNDPPVPAQTLFVIGSLPTKFTFFPMQVDLYTVAELSRHVTLYADVGANGSFEAFGLIHGLPLGAYVKAGYFIPPYGTKLPNHTAAMRQPLGFQPTDKDAGVELGLIQSWLDAAIAVTNGEPGSPLDLHYRPAVTGRLALIHDFGAFRATAGGSYMGIASDVQVTDAAGGSHILTTNEARFGGFLWLSAGRLTYIGEWDRHLKDDATKLNAQNRATRSGQDVLYNELMVLFARGVDAGVTYEFMDRDIYSSGDVLHRFGVQGSIFPAPFTELQAFVRYYKAVFTPTAAEPRRAEDGKWEVLAFLHLFF
jgi:hypothetical protein